MWFDYDRDGWLDLCVGHEAMAADTLDVPNSRYRNNGDGSFPDVPALACWEHASRTVSRHGAGL